MSYLFQLEIRRLARMIRAWGMHPILALIVLAGLCIVATKACLHDERYPYLIMALGLTLPGFWQKPNRLRFFAVHFSKPSIRNMNLLQALILSIAPLLVLLLARQFMLAGIFIALMLLRALVPLQIAANKTIPSPFGRWPYEFTRGFRLRFWLLPLCVFILIMAWKTSNPNLGLFAIAIPYLMCIGFQLNPEDSHFVWIHHHSPGAFLWHKIKISIRYTALLGIPLSIAHLIVFPSAWLANAVLCLTGFALVITALLAKYATFPSELNLLAAFVLINSMFFPPLMLLAIPVLFNKAARNIQFYL
jgi:hypothetical protein